ncbi:MAG: hypothetical protein JWN04_5923 [Myxococcaceae bacterium]|nr:hypothetical protein [Myxococcaceae bacterium]
MTTEKNRLPELDNLRAKREQLRLQLHLASADARDEFHVLEKKWERLDEILHRTSDHAGQSLHAIGADARKLVDELEVAYGSIKRALHGKS